MPQRHRLTLHALQDLGPVRQALAEAARIEKARAAAAAAEAARRAREAKVFELTVGEVTPLRDAGLAQLPKTLPEPLPLQHWADEAEALRSSLSDEMDVERLLETDDTLSFRRPGIGPDVLKRLRKGHWSIQAELDLHGLRRDDAREHLADFVRDAVQRGLRCVRVVHGKGLGSPGRMPVLKSKVQSWLVQKNEVSAFTQARAAEGGAGALVVLLRGRAR